MATTRRWRSRGRDFSWFAAGAAVVGVLGWAGLSVHGTIADLDSRITRIEQFLTVVTSQPHGISSMKVSD